MPAGPTGVDRPTAIPRANLSPAPAAPQQPSLDTPLKILSIGHAAIKAGSERDRYLPLAATPGIRLTLLIPSVFENFGANVIADPSLSPFDIRIQPIRLRNCGRAKWYLHYYPGLSSLIDELRPDVVHLWEEPWSLVALQALRLCKRQSPRPGFVLETEQNILYRLPPPFELIRRYTLRHADALLVRQPQALEVCRACGYKGTAEIAEYYADPKKFFPHDRTGARAELGLEAFTIGYFGRMVEEKGLFTILEALHLCQNDVRLLLVGDGPERNRLTQRVTDLNLQHRVKFVPWAHKDQIPRIMNALDALALVSLTTPTWKEQFGRIIMEAQACGVPAIGSTSGAIPSVVGPGGWVVPERDPAALSQLLDRLASNAAEVADKAERGLQQARTRYSPASLSSALQRAFVHAAENRKRNATRSS